MYNREMYVLFVDDDINLLRQAKIFLEKEDDRLDIETIHSPKKALQKLKKNDYDAIVSDYQMPEMTGLEFLKVIGEEIMSDTPFIIFTGRGREEVAIKALNLGANRYLRKGGDPKSQYGTLAHAIIEQVKHYRTEKRLKESEKRYRTILENANEWIWTLDKEGNFLYVNKAARRGTGYQLKKWKGKSFEGVIHPEDLQKAKKVFSKTIEGKSQKYTIRILDKEGNIKRLEVNTAPLKINGKIKGTTSIGRKIE